MDVVKSEYYVQRIIKTVNADGYLKSRENSMLEFKESFNLGNICDYTKTMASFANNRGGVIVFGVKDNPRIPVGIKKERFEGIKQEKITTFLIEHLSPEIDWELGITEIDGKHFGYILTKESINKPVICKCNNGELKSGEIYYRYRGQNRKIEFPELQKIMNEIRENEKMLWMKHIERIANIGPRNVAFMDLMRGNIETHKMEGNKLIIDKALLGDLKEKVKFIEEGNFSEKDGAPALKLIGEVQASDFVIIPSMEINSDYPYIQKQLAEELGLKPYEVHVLIWKYNIKNDKKFCISVVTSKSGKVFKFSKLALDYLRRLLQENKDNKDYIKQISKEFHSYPKDQIITEQILS